MRNQGHGVGLMCICFAMLAGAAHGQANSRERVLSRLPRYDPAIRAAKVEAESKRFARPPVDDDVVSLPDYLVVEKKLHRPDAQEVMSRSARAKEAMRVYSREMNGLELALNRWHIPFLSASFAERAIADQEQKRLRSQMAGFAHIANVVSASNPGSAAKIRAGMDFNRLPKDD